MSEVAKYKGFPIYYLSKKFTAKVNDLELAAGTQDELEKKIDKLLKSTGIFPLGVYRISNYGRGYCQHGRLTSYDAGSKRGFFVSDDGQREKLWQMSELYLADNKRAKEIFDEVSSIHAQIKVLEKKAEAVVAGLKDIKSFDEVYEELVARHNAKQSPEI